MKKLALVAAHFPPGNLAAVHRARLWAQHLPEFGWEPVVVTTHWRHYEEALDWDLHALLPQRLRVIRTRALPVLPGRPVGDIGLRAFPFHLRQLRELAQNGEIDFLHVTVPSYYSALLGPRLWASHQTPYGIDYIDPWVHEWPGSRRHFSRAWASQKLSAVLEPMAVKQARLITGISPGYFAGVLERNPHLRGQVVTAAMPYGASEQDFDGIRAHPRKPRLFDPLDGCFHLFYAGALLPKAHAVLERLFEALVYLRGIDARLFARLRLHFAGTGSSANDPKGHTVLPLVERYGLAQTVDEHPQRIAYAEVLNHLMQADGVLVLGSTEPHYSPSKIFQAVHSRRPVLALLHEASTAIAALRDSGAGEAITFTETVLPSAGSLATTVAAFVASASQPRTINVAAFEAYSARNSARQLATALDEAIARVPR